MHPMGGMGCVQGACSPGKVEGEDDGYGAEEPDRVAASGLQRS